MTNTEVSGNEIKVEVDASIQELLRKKVQPYVWINGQRERLVSNDEHAITESGKLVPRAQEFRVPLGRRKIDTFNDDGNEYVYRAFSFFQMIFGISIDLGFDIYQFPAVIDVTRTQSSGPTFAWKSGESLLRLVVEQGVDDSKGYTLTVAFIGEMSLVKAVEIDDFESTFSFTTAAVDDLLKLINDQYYPSTVIN